MNIVFLTSEATHHYYLINEITKYHPVKKVFYQTIHLERTGWKNRFKRLAQPKQLRFIARRVLSNILFHADNMAQASYEKMAFFNGRDPALDSAIPAEKIYSFNDPEVVEKVKRENPDLIIVFGTDILKGEILKIARLNILNIHREILPKYRGGGMPFWVFYKNDFENLGVTVHICARKLDAGHIVAQKRYQLKKDDRIYTLRHKTTLLAIELLKEVIDKYKTDTIEFTPQKKTKLWTARKLTLVKEFKARKNFERHIKSLGHQNDRIQRKSKAAV
jgi:methionyl-tRNA formyltransferase